MSSYSQKQINRLCNKSVRLQQDIKLSFEEIEKLDKLEFKLLKDASEAEKPGIVKRVRKMREKLKAQ